MHNKYNLIVVLGLILFLSFASAVFAEDTGKETISLDNLLVKIQVNQNKIVDMYAETTTKITSNLQLPTSSKSEPQTMVQKSKMWTKGHDKSKIEMISPTKQITIINGNKRAIIDPVTGQKMIQDLSKVQGPMSEGQGQKMDLEKAKEYFDLSVTRLLSPVASQELYVVTGVPKKSNKFLTKMEFYIDPERWLPQTILMYGPNNKLLNRSEMTYKQFEIGKDEEKDHVWLPIKTTSLVNTPMGRMEVEMVFEKIKVNEGIKDSEFKI